MRKTYTPFPRQTKITKAILRNPRLAVWSYMGSGKTAATLDAILTLQICGYGKALVVSTLEVARNVWPNEAKEWDVFEDLRVSPVVGSREDRLKALRVEADVYTVNFENVSWLVETLAKKWPFEIIVVDESSRLKGFRGSFQRHPKSGKIYLRSGGTKNSAALARAAHTHCKRFVELTGTPTTNGLEKLWAQAWFIDAGKRLGNTFTTFSQRWFDVGYNGFSLTPKSYAEDEIYKLTSDIATVIEPEKIETPVINDIEVILPPHAFSIYRKMQRDFLVSVNNKEITAANAGAKSVKLSQIANGFLYHDENEGRSATHIHDAKIEKLESVAAETDANLLVVYRFREDIAKIKKAFPKAVCPNDGRNVFDDWNKGKIRMLLLHAASAGHGLSLQHGGNHIVFYGIGPDAELYRQVVERIGPARQKASGYNRAVYVHHLIAKGTVDEHNLAVALGRISAEEAFVKLVASCREDVENQR